MNKASVFTFIILLFGTMIFTSCEEKRPKIDALEPKAIQHPGRLLVVLDDKFWDTKLEGVIKEFWEQPITTMPKPHEKFVDLQIASRETFDGSDKRQNTILIFDIADEPSHEPARLDPPMNDFWAQGQWIRKIKARTPGQAAKVFMLHAELLKNEIIVHHRELAGNAVGHIRNGNAEQKIKENIGIDLKIPTGMFVQKDTLNFMGLNKTEIRREDGKDHEVQLNVLIYSYPYIDDSTFTNAFQIARRDSITKKFIKIGDKGFEINEETGEYEITDGQGYMSTEKIYGGAPESQPKTWKDLYVLETRGKWISEGTTSLMGGPFLNICFFDEANKRIINIDGFVYAPFYPKRELMRQLEHILYNFEL